MLHSGRHIIPRHIMGIFRGSVLVVEQLKVERHRILFRSIYSQAVALFGSDQLVPAVFDADVGDGAWFSYLCRAI